MTINIKNKVILILACLSSPFLAQAQENYGMGLFINGFLFFICLPIALILFFIIRLALQKEDEPLGTIPSIVIAVFSYFIVHFIGLAILTP